MHKRLNITLPEDTVRVIDRVTKKGDRSQFIARAVSQYLTSLGRAKLREGLRTGAVARASRDLELAEDWFAIEQETWPKRNRKPQR